MVQRYPVVRQVRAELLDQTELSSDRLSGRNTESPWDTCWHVACQEDENGQTDVGESDWGTFVSSLEGDEVASDVRQEECPKDPEKDWLPERQSSNTPDVWEGNGPVRDVTAQGSVSEDVLGSRFTSVDVMSGQDGEDESDKLDGEEDPDQGS